MRSLFFFLIVLGVFFLVMFAYSRFQTLQNRAEPKPKPEKSNEPMVKCEQCGVYLPQKEALVSADQKNDHAHYFCCKKHQQAFLKQKS